MWKIYAVGRKLGELAQRQHVQREGRGLCYSPGTPEPGHARAGSFVDERSHNLLSHVSQHSKSGFHDEINETWAETQAESSRQEEDLCGVTASAIADSRTVKDRVKKIIPWKRDRQTLEKENRVIHWSNSLDIAHNKRYLLKRWKEAVANQNINRCTRACFIQEVWCLSQIPSGFG